MSTSVRHPALVEADWIAARLGDPLVRVVELDVSPAAFDSGHIPGAVFWNAYADLRPAAYRPLAADGLARLLSRSGIGPGTAVVFYGYAAYLGFWLMRSHGHSEVYVLDGGRERWLEAGYEWTVDPAAPGPAAYPVGDGVQQLATLPEMLELIGDPGTVLVDVRSREEFEGERFWPSGAGRMGDGQGHAG